MDYMIPTAKLDAAGGVQTPSGAQGETVVVDVNAVICLTRGMYWA